MTNLQIIEKLKTTGDASDEELVQLLTMPTGLSVEEFFPNTPSLCEEGHEEGRLPRHPEFTEEEEALFAAADDVFRLVFVKAGGMDVLLELR